MVVDGGSTDETLSTIEQTSNVVSMLLTGPEDGMYDAANTGIGALSGEIVSMLNADDFYAHKDVLRDIAESVAEGCDAVYGDLH